jgi:D-alanyl-lipoteichoic acid acyltransferase DltB (MBOAT superfamily)
MADGTHPPKTCFTAALLLLYCRFTAALLLLCCCFRCWALADGMDPPENMRRCVNNNYSFAGFWRAWHVFFFFAYFFFEKKIAYQSTN